MSYDVLIMVFLILIFCFFTMTLTVNVMFSLINASKQEGMKELKPIIPFKRKTKKQREADKKAIEEQRQYETIMRNLEAYDGTGIGQEEVK